MTVSNVTSNATALTAAQIAASNGTGAGAAASGSSNSALDSLTANYSDFLTLLTTQLQNQDPSSPMDTSQFTQELVQFAGVEQQINTNSDLGQLVTLSQAGNIATASGMLGATVTANSTELPLQNGKASLSFTAASAGNVHIEVSNSQGSDLYDTTLAASAGPNIWNWNGTDGSGGTLPDGAYDVSVTGTGADGSTASLPFSITGTATSIDSQANDLSINLGAVNVPFTSITSVIHPTASS